VGRTENVYLDISVASLQSAWSDLTGSLIKPLACLNPASPYGKDNSHEDKKRKGDVPPRGTVAKGWEDDLIMVVKRVYNLFTV